VLLLEAGGDPDPISDIPYALPTLSNSDMWVDYVSVPQTKACVSNFGGECGFPRGKALGGSSSVNGLLYNRCNSKDYDAWANFTNDPIWRFDSVVDAFKAVENYHGFYEDTPGPTHGTEGEIYIGRMEFLPGVDVLLDALVEGGYAIGDLNSGRFPSGFSKIDYNIKDGLRHSAYHGFLEPILSRTNLKIYRYATATKIHLDDAKRAVGVTYSRHGQTRYVAANKEVILAAGVIDSPKLLMLSGIGPREHLAQHGIETVLEMPAVGENLQEHLGFRLYHWTLNTTFGSMNYTTPEAINEYVTNGTGPLLGIPWYNPFAPHVAMGYFTSKTYNDPSWPDIHVYINEQVLDNEGQPEETIFVELELVRSEQTGTIRLASANPEDHPLIDPRFLQNPTDVERVVEGIEEMVDFFLNSPTYQALGIKWKENETRIPECEMHSFPSKDYWRCFVYMTADTALHPTSTCRMGPNVSVAVVDSKLRVFGTTGLRVIDSSVMPFAPNGNTNLPSIMIGEMGARMILNQI